MNFGTTRLRGRPRNRWQDEVREDGRIVGGKGWQEKVHNREEWKKLLRMARNRRILHMPMERMNASWKQYVTGHLYLQILLCEFFETHAYTLQQYMKFFCIQPGGVNSSHLALEN